MIRLLVPIRLAAVFGAAGMLLAGCGVSVGADEPVATLIFGSGSQVEIVQDDLRQVVADLAGSDRFIDLVYGGQLPENLESGVLTSMVQLEVFRAEAANLGLGTEGVEEQKLALLEQLEGDLSQSGDADPAATATEIGDELGSYLDLVAERLTLTQALQARYVADADGSTDGTPCVSHILVDLESGDLAEEILDRLDDGEDFAELAVEFSIDPGSAAAGGDLGCANPQTYVAAFRDAILSAELDLVVGPIESEFGIHLLKVTGYDQSAAAAARLVEPFATVDIAIDPQVGAWDRGAQSIVPATQP